MDMAWQWRMARLLCRIMNRHSLSRQFGWWQGWIAETVTRQPNCVYHLSCISNLVYKVQLLILARSAVLYTCFINISIIQQLFYLMSNLLNSNCKKWALLVRFLVACVMVSRIQQLCGGSSGQLEAILHRKDMFVRMATGSRKSLCMFLPPLATRDDWMGMMVISLP